MGDLGERKSTPLEIPCFLALRNNVYKNPELKHNWNFKVFASFQKFWGYFSRKCKYLVCLKTIFTRQKNFHIFSVFQLIIKEIGNQSILISNKILLSSIQDLRYSKFLKDKLIRRKDLRFLQNLHHVSQKITVLD